VSDEAPGLEGPYRSADEPEEAGERRLVLEHLAGLRRQAAAHIRSLESSNDEYVRWKRKEYVEFCKSVDGLIEFAIGLVFKGEEGEKR